MNDLQICLCGAQAGYPHAWDCPRPLYKASPPQYAQWEVDRAAIQFTGVHPNDPQPIDGDIVKE